VEGAEEGENDLGEFGEDWVAETGRGCRQLEGMGARSEYGKGEAFAEESRSKKFVGRPFFLATSAELAHEVEILGARGDDRTLRLDAMRTFEEALNDGLPLGVISSKFGIGNEKGEERGEGIDDLGWGRSNPFQKNADHLKSNIVVCF
jgi:hypothetical protein